MSQHPTPRKRVAILLENQFEDSAYQVPSTALRKAGVTVSVIGSRMNEGTKTSMVPLQSNRLLRQLK